MTEPRLGNLTSAVVGQLVDRGVFTFADCSGHGFVPVGLRRLDDGWLAICPKGPCRIEHSTVVFLDRRAARVRGYGIDLL